MERIVDYLNEELDKMGSGRPDDLDSLRRADGGFAAWADAGAALGSFSGMLAILWEMAEEHKGGARTMAEVAGRYSRLTAERMEETLASTSIATVFRDVAESYDQVKTYRELSAIVEAHARWVERLRQWVYGELPWEDVAACVDEAWSKKDKRAKGKKARKDDAAKAEKAAAKAAKKAKRAEKGKKSKKKPRKGNKGK